MNYIVVDNETEPPAGGKRDPGSHFQEAGDQFSTCLVRARLASIDRSKSTSSRSSSNVPAQHGEFDPWARSWHRSDKPRQIELR